NYVDSTRFNHELFLAVESRNLKKIESLIEAGADVNSRDTDGLTPLILSSWKGYSEAVSLLLDKGAYINATDKDGDTPLIAAALAGYFETVKDTVAALPGLSRSGTMK